MKKNFSVNIQGRLFNVDEDAYALLEQYISHLNEVFAGEPSQESIISDFQKKISQKLHDQLKHLKTQVVTIEIVRQILADLGFEEQKSDEEETQSSKKQQSASYKRLYRHPDNRYLGGVCGGIAAYFSIDPIIVRILFAVFTVVFAVGLLAYLILWIVVPPAHSPIERLNMKGERISAEKVKQVVTEEFKEVEKSFEKLRKDTFESDAFADVGKGIGDFIKFPVLVRFFVGSLFIAISSFFIIGLLIMLVPPLNLGNYEGIFIEGFSHLGELLFNSAIMGSILKWSLIMMFLIPFAGVFMYGISLISGLSAKTAVLRWVSQYLGTISIIIFFLCVVWVYIQFLFLHKQEQKLNFSGAYYSEYVLDVKKESDSQYLLKGKPIVVFELASGDTLSTIVQTRAYGRNSVKAAKNNSDIIMNIETSRDTVFIAPHWFTETDIWRGQNVKVVVSVPLGRRISMTPRFADYFFMGEGEGGKKIRFKMTNSGPEKI